MIEALLTLLFFAVVSFGFMAGLLLIVAYLLWADRKIWAAVQMRRGPNVVGPWGLFQSFADLIKFALKEVVIPDGANKGVFVIAPLVTATLALAAATPASASPERGGLARASRVRRSEKRYSVPPMLCAKAMRRV